MKIVIKNGIVITMDENKKEKVEKLDIVIENDIIIDLIKNYNGDYDEIIDAKNKVVMPGLINCHTHLGMSIFKAINDNLTLDEWLNKKIWPVENRLSDEDIYYSTLYSCIELIKTGTTTINDMYFSENSVVKALKEAKLRALFGNGMMDINGNGNKNTKEFLDIYNKYKDDKLIKFTVAPHAFYTCSKDYLIECSKLAQKLNLPIHIHFCENEREVLDINKSYGSDINALKGTNLINNKLILAHTTFITQECLDELKNKDVSFVHNPISNLNLGCGIANISKYKDYVNICLGTDGVGSGNNLNMFYHMSLVDLLQKGVNINPKILSSYDILKMATINGAKALGLEKEIGSIEKGKKADIVILNLDQINTFPTIDLFNNIVHNVSINNIDTTIVNGEILMKNKKLKIDIDINEIKDKILDIIKSKMNNSTIL